VDENAREIEREITEAREDLDDDLRQLRNQARALTDWRRQYRNHTGVALGAAFAGGVALALMTGPRRSRPDYLEEFEPDEFHQMAESQGHHQRSHHPPRSRRLMHNIKALSDTRPGRQLSDTLLGVFETLVGVASAKAVKVVADLIPGFQDEFEARHGYSGRSNRTH
jgi:hypothetical protein